jgi:hypothetical protein
MGITDAAMAAEIPEATATPLCAFVLLASYVWSTVGEVIAATPFLTTLVPSTVTSRTGAVTLEEMVMVLWFSVMEIPVPAVNVFGTGLFSI